MRRYDFAELTDYDFECLVHDLLQAEWDITLELFTPGQDRGIDLRGLTDEDETFIVQCKRWAADSWRKLYGNLKQKERLKVEALNPERYVLAASVNLTPSGKDDIVALMAPWLTTPSDVFARDDILGLLAKHSAVERNHIKLWITSTEVLDAVLNMAIANRTQDVVEDAKRALRLWVPNPSFNDAKTILDSQQVCVIAGAPGIGKSMLAQVLLADYSARGFEPVVITSDISEGDTMWRSGKAQVFYYDDFLGRVTLGELALRKNEDADLARFFARVKSAPEKRFLLTTRIHTGRCAE